MIDRGEAVGSYWRARTGRIALAVGIGLMTSAVALPAGATSSDPVDAPGVTPTTVRVASISDISAPVPGLFKGASVGTEAYFAYVNSQGGINGRKLELDALDSAFSSGTVASETQQIVKSALAMVGGFSLLDSAEQPGIDGAKLPDVSQVLSPQLFLDPNVYSAIPSVADG